MDILLAQQLVEGLIRELQTEKWDKVIQKRIWNDSLALATTFSTKVHFPVYADGKWQMDSSSGTMMLE